MLRPPPRRRHRNNSDRVSALLTSLVDEEKEEEKVENIEETQMLKDTNDALYEENQRLRHHLMKMLESYPKHLIFNKLCEDKCPICLEIFNYNEKIRVTTCIHVFHKACIQKQMDQDNLDLKCSVCRNELKSSLLMSMIFGFHSSVIQSL